MTKLVLSLSLLGLIAAACNGAVAPLDLGSRGAAVDGVGDNDASAPDSSMDASLLPSANFSVLPPLELPRTDHSAAVVDGKIFVMGGSTGASMLARVDMFDPSTSTWTRKADLLSPRRDFATAVIDGKIYVTGGMTGLNTVSYVASTDVYDPSTDAWTSVAPCPLAPAVNEAWGNLFVGGTAFEGRFYVLVFNAGESPTTTMLVYDPQTNTWTVESTPAPAFPSSQIDMVVLDDTLYVLTSYYGPGDPSTSLWAWNAAEHLWMPRPPLVDVWRAAYVGAAGKLWALGGVVGDSGYYDATNAIYEYDPLLEKWSHRGTLNVAREYPAAAVVDGQIYVIGGDVPVMGSPTRIPSGAVERGAPW